MRNKTYYSINTNSNKSVRYVIGTSHKFKAMGQKEKRELRMRNLLKQFKVQQFNIMSWILDDNYLTAYSFNSYTNVAIF